MFEAPEPQPRRPRRAERLLGRRAFVSCAGAAGLEVGRFGLAVGLHACAGDPGALRRVTLETWSDPASHQLDNAHGYRISLDAARLGIDHLYFVTGDPIGGGFSLRSLATPRAAHAHPGHYAAGDVLAEMNDPTTLDLFGRSRRLSRGEAITGSARSCVLRFGEIDAERRAVAVRGEAAREGLRWRFEADVKLSELLHGQSELPEVPGIVVERGEIEAGGRMRWSVDPAVWFDQVDFERLAPADSGEQPSDTLVFPRESQPHNALLRGVRKAIAYHVIFQESA